MDYASTDFSINSKYKISWKSVQWESDVRKESSFVNALRKRLLVADWRYNGEHVASLRCIRGLRLQTSVSISAVIQFHRAATAASYHTSLKHISDWPNNHSTSHKLLKASLKQLMMLNLRVECLGGKEAGCLWVSFHTEHSAHWNASMKTGVKAWQQSLHSDSCCDVTWCSLSFRRDVFSPFQDTYALNTEREYVCPEHWHKVTCLE